MNAEAMTLQALKLKSLINFDRGYFEALVDQALEKIAADLNDRPGVKKARGLDISMDFKPNLAPDGTCDSVIVSYQIQTKTPPAVSKEMPLEIAASGEMLFRGMCPDDPSQLPLPMDLTPTDEDTDQDSNQDAAQPDD